LLRDLDRQDPSPMEIVLAVDGDVDGTAAAVRALRMATPVRVIVHEHNMGAAVARNSGLRAAGGDIVLFLDDDVSPVGQALIAEHLATHRQHDRPVAVVGPCLPGDVPRETPFAFGVRNWWVDHVGRLSREGPLTFTDLGTGNFSIARTTLEAVGGFRELPRREDWELGYRLQRRGVTLLGAPAAAVVHPIDVTVSGLLRDRIDEGAGDFYFAEEHPEVAHLLPVWGWYEMDAPRKAMVTGLFSAPQWGERAVTAIRVRLAALDRLGARTRFHTHLAQALLISYWTGVARAATSKSRFLEALSRSPARAPSQAPPTADFELCRSRWDPPEPSAVDLDLTVNGRVLARVPSRWGGFPWSADDFGRRARANVDLDEVVEALDGANR
jgi:hypothetical protein